MSEIRIERASPEEARIMGRRRGLDAEALRLSLELAERGTVWIARDGGESIGIATACDSEYERYAGDLFVEASYRGQGVGARLLAELFAGDERSRTMLVPSDAPAALALALRGALTLREPVLRFAGAIPAQRELAAMAAGEYRFSVDAVDPLRDRFALDDLDRKLRGTMRSQAHEEFARRADGRAFLLDGEFVGYAYVWPDGHIGPLACASPAYLVQILAFALMTLTRRFGASWCTTLVPGANAPVARAALRAGLRIGASFVLASDAHALDLSAYVGFRSELF